jgi:toxin ParE1/3/4
MNKYRLRPAAERDLEGIWLHTLDRWGARSADKYIDDLDDCFALLADNPLACTERGEFTPAVRIHHHRSHLIVYTAESAEITILRVLHQSMDIGHHLTATE